MGKFLGTIAGAITIAIVTALIVGYVVMMLWNMFMVPKFGLPTFEYSDGIMLYLLAFCLAK